MKDPVLYFRVRYRPFPFKSQKENMNKLPYRIYNASAETMNEVQSETIDLILSSPQYNAGAVFGDWKDTAPFESFKQTLTRLICECARTLKTGGKLIIECADTAISEDGTYMSIGALYVKIGLACGLNLVERHVAYTLTKDGVELPEHGWSDDFVAQEATHSNAHQLVVLQKGVASFQPDLSKIIYYNYPANEEGHPCPFAFELIDFVLGHYFKPGDTVLDPYMGTARLGREVIKRGGIFIGYDINPEYCKVAEDYLSRAAKSMIA